MNKSPKTGSLEPPPPNGGVARSTAYIPAAYLSNLKKWKYSGADFSLIGKYIMQSWWNFVVSLLPMTLAPNFITFSGWVLGMSSTVVLLYYYFSEAAVYPSWAWYYATFSLFGYQTLDAIDGKQARRTGSSSPLGELFDHGCDAFLTPFVGINVALALNMPPWMRYAYMMESNLGLFTAIWEQFSTGTLDLGYLNGPTEGILLVSFLFLLSGRYGNAVFDTPVAGPYTLTVPTNPLSRLLTPDPVTIHIESLRSFMFLAFLGPWLLTVTTNVIHTAIRPTTQKHRGIPFIAGVTIALAASMNAVIFALYPVAHERFPFVFELSLGLLVSFTVTRLTISRLCALPYKPYTKYYIGTIAIYAAIIAAKLCSLTELASMPMDDCVGWAMTYLAVSGAYQYGHMVFVVFGQIAAYLNINIMSIKPKKTD